MRFTLSLAMLFVVAIASADDVTKIRDLRRLTAEESKQGRRVQIQGVVTYFNTTRRGDLIVQDETGGGFIGRTKVPPALKPGDYVQIAGRTFWGTYVPMIDAESIDVIGQRDLPPPRSVTYDQVMAGNEVGQWVTISGIVRSAHIDMEQEPPRLLLDVAASGARFRAWILDFQPEDPGRFVDAKVHLTGVPVALSNNDGKIFNFRLLMSKQSEISVERPAPENPYSAEPISLQNLRQCRPDTEIEHRVHVGGIVTGWQPGKWLAIVEGGGALQIRTEQTSPELRTGDRIRAVGFPARGEYGVILEDAVFELTGERGTVPLPVPVTPAEALKCDSRLISIDAVLLGMVRRKDALLLTLQADGALFEANLDWNSPGVPWPELQPGSLLHVSGICTVSAGDDIRYLRSLNPQAFRVALRNQTDLRILKKPSWLTPDRVKIIMMAMALATVLLLRHHHTLREQIRARTAAEDKLQKANDELEIRVEERSREIEREISARREAEGALRERNRVAAEIHDGLQQGLTALAAQLAIAGETVMKRSDLTSAAIEQARALLRYIQEEIRRTVWNLRSPTLKGHGLASSLEELGHTLLSGGNVAFNVVCKGESFEIPAMVQHHLMRIGQESLTNALKHGRPSKIDVCLNFGLRSVSLAIVDNGKGFLPEHAPGQESGHFGLIGMRERVRQLEGTFVLESTPEKGTKIAVIVPLVVPRAVDG